MKRTFQTKRWVILLLLVTCHLSPVAAVSANERAEVINDANHPVPVNVLSNYTSPSVTSAPGATPNPSPAKAVNIQGEPGMTAVTVHPDGTPFPVKIDQTTSGSTNAVQPRQYTGVPSTFTPGTTDATVFTLAAGEIGFIQNLSADAALAVKKGASASTSSFNYILAAGTATDDGKGGAVKIDDWVGAVSVAKISGTARYIAWKQAP